MEHLALEIFDLATKDDPKPTGSKYAVLEEDQTITITDTSEIFASGDVWSHRFRLDVAANAHIFGTAGDLHGARLHYQIHRRRARLWVEGLPLFLGYLTLGDEAEVDEDGSVDVGFESGQKTFEEMIEGISAREVSVGDDVVIGVALNRKRTVVLSNTAIFTLEGLKAYANKIDELKDVAESTFDFTGTDVDSTYTQRWPKLVKSHGTVLDAGGTEQTVDYTNVQTPYDGTEAHPFCNVNICYQFKSVDAAGEEEAGRGYTTRLAHGKPTVDGGDNQTRFNNAPNFYLLYFIDHLFSDMQIHVMENQAMDVEDLRRVFLLNYGCHYEEMENDSDYFDDDRHTTPEDTAEKPFRSRYGQYYIPVVDVKNADGEVVEARLLDSWDEASKPICEDESIPGKILVRDLRVTMNGTEILKLGSVEGITRTTTIPDMTDTRRRLPFYSSIVLESIERNNNAYSSYLAYATGDNYPNVEIGEIVNAMKSMFGIRLLFDNDYSTVRIVLLRNIFRSKEIQDIDCEIVAPDVKIENNTRGFRMTYGKGTEDTAFYYKGFNDLFARAGKIWRDTSDKHDYSQWRLNADYNEIKQYVSAMNKICYVTPLTGNAYIVKVDEEQDVLFPSLLEAAEFMDAEDGDCTRLESESETVKEIQAGASPVVMNKVDDTFAVLFSGDLKAPSPENFELSQKIATFGRATRNSASWSREIHVGNDTYGISGLVDLYVSEGFRIRMEDNYAISNGGTPFDETDPGLCFGIMRSSGDDAYVKYYDDPDDNEVDENGNENDAWEIVPGSGAVSHPDTCDEEGSEWDYDGSMTVTPAEAPAKLAELFPDSDAPFNSAALGYITDTTWFYTMDGRKALVACAYSLTGDTVTYSGDIRYWTTLTLSELQQVSRAGRHMLIEADSSAERGYTLVQLCQLAYGGGTEPMKIDNGIGSRYGRFSLKLRAEKPNPYFDASKAEGSLNRRYLAITKESLRQRGLTDQFYKEYSKWEREARIAKRTVRMTLAQLLAIDKTKRVRVGDITGFIRKTQYSVSNKTGLGMVEMEILYI